MLSSGFGIPPSACLRCQLRLVLAQLRQGVQSTQRYRRCQPLHTARLLQQESAAVLEDRRHDNRDDRGYVYRHVNPNGRIIGRPGRRQRQSAERLTRQSLGRPSEVIVLRDVIEDTGVSRQESFQSPVDSGIRREDVETEEAALSATGAEHAVSRRELRDEQEEVNASIDALRPDYAVLDQTDFDGLVKSLVESYNMRQMTRYLVSSLGQSPFDTGETVEQSDQREAALSATQWRPGRTPIEERIAQITLNKSDVGTTKIKLADQIVRTAWGLTVRSEDQSIGELEVRLQPWQMHMLFDLEYNGKPSLDGFIESSLLRRTADLRPYKPDNVMRITARRKDAEDVVRQLEMKLSCVRHLDMDLNAFKPLLGRPRWPSHLKDMFREEDVSFISSLTGCIIERQAEDKLSIYSMPGQEQYAATARRLLLSLLNLPSTASVSTVPSDGNAGTEESRLLRTQEGKSDGAVMTECSSPNVEPRYRHIPLARLTTPIPRTLKDAASKATSATVDPLDTIQQQSSRDSNLAGGALSNGKLDLWGLKSVHSRRVTARVAGMLGKVSSRLSSSPFPKASQTGEGKESCWTITDGGRPSPWSVTFPTLLREVTGGTLGATFMVQKKSVRGRPNTFIHTHQTPGLLSLLSYFGQVSSPSFGSFHDRHGSLRLHAHFTPSPFSKRGLSPLKVLPRIAMSLQVIQPADDRRASRVELEYVQATLRKDTVDVPFPDQATDLSFVRSSTMHMNSSGLASTSHVENFRQRLQSSMEYSQDALDAMPELQLDMPWWLVRKEMRKILKDLPKQDDTVMYLLDRFEQVETTDFVPLHGCKVSTRQDAEVNDFLKQWPKDLVLRVRNVDAGGFGGRRTEVSLIWQHDRAARNNAPALDDTEADTLAMVKTARGVLKLITLANAGQLKSRMFAGSNTA